MSRYLFGMNVPSEWTTMNRKEKILESALTLFTTQGLQQTSMAQISKKSEVPVGSIYRRFEGKDELIQELYLYISMKMGQAICLDDQELLLSYRKRFFLMGEKLFTFYCKNPQYFLFKNSQTNSPLISTQIHKVGQEHYQCAIDLISEGIREKHLADVHPIFAMQFVNSGINVLMQLQFDDEFTVTKDIKEQAFTSIWNGLKNNNKNDKNR